LQRNSLLSIFAARCYDDDDDTMMMMMMMMISTAYTVMRRMSIRLSVTFVDYDETNKYIIF